VNGLAGLRAPRPACTSGGSEVAPAGPPGVRAPCRATCWNTTP